MRNVWAVVCVMVAIGLVACGGGGSGAPGGSSTTNYYPTTQGSTWTYIVTDNTTTFISTTLITQSTSTAFSLKAITTQNTDYDIVDFILLANGAWGQTTYTMYDVGGTSQNWNTISPPVQIIPSVWTIGSHETSTSTVSVPGYCFQISNDLLVLGSESLTVPAGTFNNAMKVVTTQTGQGNTMISMDWYTPDVGSIKSIRSSLSGTVTFELSSYSIH